MNKFIFKLKRHAPDILTGAAVMGVGLTAYVAHRDTIRALEIAKIQRPVTKADKAECFLRSYWPTFLVGTVTATAIIFSRKLSADQLAAVMATCTAIEKRFGVYRDKVKKELGVDKERDIYIETSQALDPDWELTPALPTKADDYDDTYVFYDLYSNRYFISSLERVQQAMYHLNRHFTMRGWACVNEYYGLLGIDGIPNGDNLGWEAMDLMDGGMPHWVDFYSEIKEFKDGAKYYILSFEVDPTVEAIERALG